MIQVRRLSKQYGSVKAIDRITFEVGQGEIVGLLGPNGAGKTTTLRMILGLVRPDGGTAEMDGAADPT